MFATPLMGWELCSSWMPWGQRMSSSHEAATPRKHPCQSVSSPCLLPYTRGKDSFAWEAMVGNGMALVVVSLLQHREGSG